MDCHNFELPDVDRVAKACEEFDADTETKIVEAALSDLFAKYPSNTKEADVLLKVVALNDLYSTQIPMRASDRPNVFDIAARIPELHLDQAFKDERLEIVDVISTTQFPERRRIINRFSFATKYASWHRRDVYPMWDRLEAVSFRDLDKFLWIKGRPRLGTETSPST